MGVVLGEAAVEALLRIRPEGEDGLPRGLAPDVTAPEGGVKVLTVPGGDVLHVVPVLEAALDLEGPDAGVEHLPEVLCLVEVAHREKVAVLGKRRAVLSVEALPHPAELRALAAVRAPSRKRRGEVAPAAHADAESAVDEGLEPYIRGCRMDFADLRKGELAGEDRLREAQILQEFHLLRG